uniref:BRX domain-containing protein n=1 Tax=Leersia perrieri TaxID=77586 RepID=A0A0D9VJW9_9ORYZ
MLACIACSTKEGGEGGHRSAAATPNAGKSLTSQLKDMVLKFSGSGRHQYKSGGSPSLRSSRFHRSSRLAAYPGIIDESGFTSDGAGEAYTYTRTTTTSGPAARAMPSTWDREMFNKWEAQRWWGENYDRVVELYNVQTFSRQQGLSTPSSSVDDCATQRDSFYSRVGSTRESPAMMMMPPPPPPPPSSSAAVGREQHPITRTLSSKAVSSSSAAARPPFYPSTAVPDPSDHVWAHHFNFLNSAAATAPCYDPSRGTTSSRGDEASVSMCSNASDLEATEWVEQDEPGVSITIREFGDGTRELRRVRFSRERFGEDRAKVWWEQNRDRIHAQYL